MRRRLMLEELDVRLVPSTYYVAPTGSDTAAGDTGHPWKTLQFAANRVVAGDQVIVRAGNYVGCNLTTDGTATNRITFTAEAGVTINTPNASGPHAGKDGINLEGADYVTIDGFKVIGMPRAGIRVVGDTGVIVRNNVCDDNVVWGILTGFAENVRIENNVCSRSHEQHGIYVSNSADNPIVRGNTVWGNAACGIHMNSDLSSGGDGVITGALIENNIVYNNGAPFGGSGINMDGVSDSRVQNNLLYNNHAGGIALYDIDGAHGAWNNVVANNTVVQASDGRWAIVIGDASTGNTVFNNILWNNHSFRGGLSVSADSLPGLKSDYNVVINRFSSDDGNTSISLSTWRTQTGQDTHSIVSTPAALFANVAGDDYHLAAASPALNAGAATLNSKAAPTADMTGSGRPSGGGDDAGPYETQVGSGGNPPTANPDSYSILHDRTLSVSAAGVLANDTSSPAGRTLTAALVTSPLHGTVTLNSDGSFTYNAAAGYVGSDAFTYTANDGSLVSSPATVSLSVTNRAPVAANNAYSTPRDQALTVSAAAGVLANDTDADSDPLTAVLVAGPANGTVTLNANGSFTYTPNAGFAGTDTFTYKANDKAADSGNATVTISVTAPPTANPDSYTLLHDRNLNVGGAGVLANDTSNPPGRALTAALVAGPAHGTLTLNANGSLTYVPAAGYTGSDSFTYTASDGTLVSSPATVSLSVTDTAPVANDDSYTVGKNKTLTILGTGVLTNDTDADSDALTAALVAGPANGTLTLNANGSFTYTPNSGFAGSDSFTYKAGDGVLASSAATVAISVTNQAPVPTTDSYTVGRGKTLTVPAAGVLANDRDADGDPLTALLANAPANGMLSLNANGSFTYTPNTGYSGPDSFTYKDNDGTVDSTAATVSITVTSAPAVKSVVINDGSAQRSLVRSITVTFDSLVTLDTGAFRLTRTGGGAPSITRTVSQINGETVVVLKFSGSGTASGSLTDGNWTLTVFGTRVHRADDRTVVMGANYTSSFHRLFGDSDGDRDVDATDQAAFNAAFGHTDAASLATFDFDRDGDVDAMDRNRFNKRFGTRI